MSNRDDYETFSMKRQKERRLQKKLKEMRKKQLEEDNGNYRLEIKGDKIVKIKNGGVKCLKSR